MSRESIYVDRRSGEPTRETVFADGFLDWSYNSRLGMALTRLCLRHPLFSALYGWYHRRSASRKKIAPFIRQMKIDATEFAQPASTYPTFNDFFIRTLAPGRRPVDSRPTHCVSPVDGKLFAIPKVSDDSVICIKQHRFNLRTFLRDDELVRRFAGGSMLICRLGLADYHHVHFPDSGIPEPPRRINGSLYAGGPYARTRWVPFFADNLRVLTPFESEHFGPLLQVEVGAFTVGSIRQLFQPYAPVAKGDHKGYFELGGSTVVLLFERNRIRFDRDLLRNSSLMLETRVKMGEHIGTATGGPS